MLWCRAVLARLSESQLTRYEHYRRASFKKAMMKKVANVPVDFFPGPAACL